METAWRRRGDGVETAQLIETQRHRLDSLLEPTENRSNATRMWFKSKWLLRWACSCDRRAAVALSKHWWRSYYIYGEAPHPPHPKCAASSWCETQEGAEIFINVLLGMHFVF